MTARTFAAFATGFLLAFAILLAVVFGRLAAEAREDARAARAASERTLAILTAATARPTR